MARFVFFSSSIASSFPPLLLCRICLTSLPNILWAIHQELFFMPILRKIAKFQKQKAWWHFFGKFTKVESYDVFFLGSTEIILGWIFQDSYYMKSLQINAKFCSSSLVFFLSMAYILIQVMERPLIVFPFFIILI